MISRIPSLLLLLTASWCVMTFTHELGHILGGVCSGGTLRAADLRPWRLPYSIFSPDPHPLVTLWLGPLLGVVIPLLAWLFIRRDWAYFIASFCVLANGCYLATAWISGDRYLDTPRLLEHGANPISVTLYCIVTLTLGYAGFRKSCINLLSPTEHLKARP